MAASSTSARTRATDAAVRWLAVLTLVTPAVVMAGVLGVRFGGWDLALGYDLLTLKVGRATAYVGLAAALAAAVLAKGDLARRGAWAGLAIIVAVTAIALYVIQDRRMAVVSPGDVTTSETEPPAFSRRVLDRGGGRVAGQGPRVCEGVGSVPSQVAPETAAWALKQAGFEVLGYAAFRAEGTREGFFFGFTHDAVIRIRPGQTDVRVTARDGRPQGDQACRLMQRVVEGLRAEAAATQSAGAQTAGV